MKKVWEEEKKKREELHLEVLGKAEKVPNRCSTCGSNCGQCGTRFPDGHRIVDRDLYEEVQRMYPDQGIYTSHIDRFLTMKAASSKPHIYSVDCPCEVCSGTRSHYDKKTESCDFWTKCVICNPHLCWRKSIRVKLTRKERAFYRLFPFSAYCSMTGYYEHLCDMPSECEICQGSNMRLKQIYRLHQKHEKAELPTSVRSLALGPYRTGNIVVERVPPPSRVKVLWTRFRRRLKLLLVGRFLQRYKYKCPTCRRRAPRLQENWYPEGPHSDTDELTSLVMPKCKHIYAITRGSGITSRWGVWRFIFRLTRK